MFDALCQCCFLLFSNVAENIGKKIFRVTMLQNASSSRSFLIEDTTTNVFPVGCPNIPFWVLSCSNFMTTTDSFLTRFVRWLNLKFSSTIQKDCDNGVIEANSWLRRGKGFDHLYCFACLSKSTPSDTHPMLWSLETCWRLLWYTFLRVYWFPATFTIFDSSTRENLEVREAEEHNLPLDANRKRHCSGKRFSDLFNKLFLTSIGLLIRLI